MPFCSGMSTHATVAAIESEATGRQRTAGRSGVSAGQMKCADPAAPFADEAGSEVAASVVEHFDSGDADEAPVAGTGCVHDSFAADSLPSFRCSGLGHVVGAVGPGFCECGGNERRHFVDCQVRFAYDDDVCRFERHGTEGAGRGGQANGTDGGGGAGLPYAVGGRTVQAERHSVRCQRKTVNIGMFTVSAQLLVSEPNRADVVMYAPSALPVFQPVARSLGVGCAWPRRHRSAAPGVR